MKYSVIVCGLVIIIFAINHDVARAVDYSSPSFMVRDPVISGTTVQTQGSSADQSVVANNTQQKDQTNSNRRYIILIGAIASVVVIGGGLVVAGIKRRTGNVKT